MADDVTGSIIVKKNRVKNLKNNNKLLLKYPVKFIFKENQDGAPKGYVFMDVLPENKSDTQVLHSDFLERLQSYVEDICKDGGSSSNEPCAAEDSSYDSDFDGEEPTIRRASGSQGHQDVSRTVSDTLGQEFDEYVSSQPTNQSPGYTARVEFALKLGYTENLVQVALQKLGPNPGQNELLAELIKLGAQGPRLPESGLEGCLESSEIALDGALIDAQHLSLRPIVIDGSNVAMSHGNKEVFSCRGIKICVDWFVSRGHTEITVFVPKWRKEAPRPDNPITDQDILGELERDRLLVFTPSRLVGGKRMVCYDDRYILKLAAGNEGIVVSNDNYRDLAQENPEFKKVVEERILMYSFVNDRFMPPDDPLGRTGPTLENFLRLQPRKGDPPRPCPYGKKCTYGNKCKYHHPERGPLPHKSVTERLSEHAQRHLLARGEPQPVKGKSLSLPLSNSDESMSKLPRNKLPLTRTKSGAPTIKDCLQSSVPKSHSVENVAGNIIQNRQKFEQEDASNLHRKLQRQLTLNPGCDPRIFQMRRYVGQTAHRPLSRHSSNAEGQNQYTIQMQMQQQPSPSVQNWDLHQSVTRIASAPDSFRPWPPGHPPPAHRQQHMHRLSSASDPQINLSVPQTPNWQHMNNTLWSNQQHQPQNLQNIQQFQQPTTEDARHKLHYHLAAIFPEEQVHQAMQLYPDETNPQKICAAILTMFPKDSLG